MLQRTPEQASGFADGETADTGIALERLADAVKREWADEESRRRLADPNPLPVSWSTVGPPVADHWENVRRDGSPEPLNLDGTLTAAKEGSSELLALLAIQDTRGRIVLLGEPGSGKNCTVVAANAGHAGSSALGGTGASPVAAVNLGSFESAFLGMAQYTACRRLRLLTSN